MAKGKKSKGKKVVNKSKGKGKKAAKIKKLKAELKKVEKLETQAERDVKKHGKKADSLKKKITKLEQY
jgi:hypothetical protein